MKLIVAALFAVALALPARAQEKDAPAKQEEKKAPAKDGGGEPVKKPAPDGKGVAKDGGDGPSLSVEEVDLNGDGRISAAELKAALGKIGGYYQKKAGGVKDGFKKDAPIEKKDAPKDGTKDGGDAKKPALKDGQK